MLSNLRTTSTLLCAKILCAFVLLLPGIGLSKSIDLKAGAKMYFEHCALCHGKSGMGEGRLPLKLASYPNVNLFVKKSVNDLDGIRKIITWGGAREGSNISELMPPMVDELSFNEITLLSHFVLYLLASPDKALMLVDEVSEMRSASKRSGELLFETRCKLCHGETGEGDGRMSKVIKTPPPANLVKSRLPPAYLSKIIELGGEPLGRSPQMPPWGDQLNRQEIDSLVEHLLSIRQ